MTLVASGDLYLVGSSGLGATRSIAKEVTGNYGEPTFFSDILDDACSVPISFSGNQLSDFYGHTQSSAPHDPVIVSLDWIGILDRVTIDWSTGTNGCETPDSVYVFKRLAGIRSLVFVEVVNNPTTVSVFTEIFGGNPTESIQVRLVSYNGLFGNDVISSIETVQ